MDKLTGYDDSNLTGVNNSFKGGDLDSGSGLSSIEHTDNNREIVDEEILSQALTLKDWVSDVRPKTDHFIHFDVSRKEGILLELFRNLYCSFARFIRRIHGRFSGKKSVEILNIVYPCQANSKYFKSGWVDSLKKGDRIDGSILSISGWLVGRNSQPIVLRLTVKETVISETLVNILRPDVMKVFFFKPPVHNSGYSMSLDVKELPNKAKIDLKAVFLDGHIVSAISIDLYKYGFVKGKTRRVRIEE